MSAGVRAKEVYIKVVRQTWYDNDSEPLIEEFHLTPEEFFVRLLLPEMEKIRGCSSNMAERLASNQEAESSNLSTRTSSKEE